MTADLTFHKADMIKRRALFALELIDPGRGLSAGDQMKVEAKGFRAPRVTSSGQYVWTDIDPPADREVNVKATATRGWFLDYATTVHVPARLENVPLVVRRATLEPTGLYDPPAGRLAAAGMLVETAQPPRTPLQGVTVELALLAKDDGSTLISDLKAKTDKRGGFVAMASDFGSKAPMPSPPPAAEGSLVGWLKFSRQATIRYSPLIRLRQGRLSRVPEPLIWDNLSPLPPSPP